jgi:hypothetical protein
MGFEEAMDAIARGVEILGILTLVLGLRQPLSVLGWHWSAAGVRRRATGSSGPCSGAPLLP